MAKELTIGDDEEDGVEETSTLDYVEELGDPGDDVEVGALVPTEKGASRVTAYDAKVAETILMKIADGATLREIAKIPGMPTKSTIQRWIMKYPELAQAWKAAREMSASSLEEEALDMARVLKKQTGFTGTKVRAFEVAMNQFRWSAAHRDPATFGQTTQPNLVIPIQINTSLDLGDGKGGGKVQVAGASTSYEVAAKFGEAYNVANAQIEGTDYTVAGGEAKPRENDIAPDIDPKRDALAVRRRGGHGGRPKKGHKTAAQTKSTITRRANKEKKNAGNA